MVRRSSDASSIDGDNSNSSDDGGVDLTWLTLLATASVGLGVATYRLVRTYGWTGAYYYVWEGSPYPPSIRQRMETLDVMTLSLEAKSEQVQELEQGLDVAREERVRVAFLEAENADHGVDDDESQHQDPLLHQTEIKEIDDHDEMLLKQWEKHISAKILQTSGLRTHLATLSYDLDRLAAKVDAIAGGDDAEVKVRKKTTSGSVVQLMERVDALIAVYTKAVEAEMSKPDPDEMEQ